VTDTDRLTDKDTYTGPLLVKKPALVYLPARRYGIALRGQRGKRTVSSKDSVKHTDGQTDTTDRISFPDSTGSTILLDSMIQSVTVGSGVTRILREGRSGLESKMLCSGITNA